MEESDAIPEWRNGSDKDLATDPDQMFHATQAEGSFARIERKFDGRHQSLDIL